MASDLAKIIKAAQDLDYSGDQLREFVAQRQQEIKAEKEAELQFKREESANKLKMAEAEATSKVKMAEAEAAIKKEKLANKLKLAEAELEITRMKMEAEERIRKEELLVKSRTVEVEAINKKLTEEYALDERRKNSEMELRKHTELMENQIKLKELELKALEKRATPSTSETSVNNGSSMGNAKFLKLPIFKEEKDCLDAYLLRFERMCTAYGIPSEQWALVLVKSLEGKALAVYQGLTNEESLDYDTLKVALLKRFRLTESGYRNLFKTCTREIDETATDYVVRLQRYLKQWMVMSGCEDSQSGLAELFIKDQFFTKSDDEMRRFLKERGKLSLQEMVQQAQNFIESREYGARKWTPDTQRHKAKDNRPFQKETEFKKTEKSTGFQKQDKPNGSSKEKTWFKNKWEFKQQKKDSNNTEVKHSGCFRCGSKSHMVKDCVEPVSTNKTQAIAAIVLEDERNTRETQTLNNKDKTNEVNVQPAIHHEDYCSKVLLNDQLVSCLYDTG